MSKVQIKPISDKIVILPDENAYKLPSGIELPGSAKKTMTQTGTVVAVGPGFLLNDGTRATPTVAVGDTVAFGSHSGADLEVEGITYVVINEEQIYVTLNTVSEKI